MPGLSAPQHNGNDDYISYYLGTATCDFWGCAVTSKGGDEKEHNLSYQTIYGWLKCFQKNM